MPLTLFERVVCERELETEQRLQHINLASSSGHSSVSFSFSWAAQPEAWGPALRWELVLTARSWTLLQNSDLQLQLLNRGPEGPLCWVLVLSTASYLQLIWTSCRRVYIRIWHPPTSCERHNFALNSNPRQSRSPLISWYLRLDAPVIDTGAFLLLTACPVGGQYATYY